MALSSFLNENVEVQMPPLWTRKPACKIIFSGAGGGGQDPCISDTRHSAPETAGSMWLPISAVVGSRRRIRSSSSLTTWCAAASVISGGNST